MNLKLVNFRRIRRGDRANRLLNLLSFIVLALVSILFFYLILIPKLVGGQALTVLTGSMKPNLHPGDIVAIKPTDFSSLEVGDVITFQLESGKPALVTHRVVGVGSTLNGLVSLVTKGDANNTADLNSVRPEQVVGKVMYSIPKLGLITNNISYKVKKNSVVAIGLMAMFYGIVVFIRPNRSRKIMQNLAKGIGTQAHSDGKHRAHNKPDIEKACDNNLLLLVALICVGVISILNFFTGISNSYAAETDDEHLIVWSIDGLSWQSEEKIDAVFNVGKLIPEQRIKQKLWIKNRSTQEIKLNLIVSWTAQDSSLDIAADVAAIMKSEILLLDSGLKNAIEAPIVLEPFQIRAFELESFLPSSKPTLDTRNTGLVFELQIQMSGIKNQEPHGPQTTTAPPATTGNQGQPEPKPTAVKTPVRTTPESNDTPSRIVQTGVDSFIAALVISSSLCIIGVFLVTRRKKSERECCKSEF